MPSRKLGELVNITIGRTPSRSDSEFWDKNKETQNIWLSIADLLNVHGRIVNDSREYISDVAARAFPIVPKGTLLVSFKLTLGRLAFAGCDLRTNEAIAALRNDETIILNEYLYYFLMQFDWMSYASADKKVKGFTLNKAKLHEINIVYPKSLDTQRAIVAKLDNAFGKINQAIKLTANNIENSQILFDNLLTETFNELTNIEFKKLGDVYDVRDGTHDSPKYHKQGFPLVTSKNLKTGTLDMNNVQYVSEADYNKINDRSKVDKGDVLMAMIGTIGNPIVIEQEPNFAIKNVALFKPLDYHNGKFLRYYLQSGSVKTKMGNDAKGATQKFVSLGYLRSFAFPVVPAEKEMDLVSRLDEVSGKTRLVLAKHTEKLAALKNLKRSMLNEMLKESAAE